MFAKLKFDSQRILIISLVLTSGSILNIIGMDEFLLSTLFVGVLVLSIKRGLLTRKSFTLISLLTLLVLIILFALQAVENGNFTEIYNKNNLKMLLLVSICLLASYYLGSRNAFIEQLHLVLLVFTLHGIISCLVFSIFPTQNVLFSAVDLKSSYLGYWFGVIQRVNVDYLGNVDPATIELLGKKLFRANGVAWEPGNFAAYVNIFVFINLFVRKNTRSVIIGVIALVLAFSSIGFIVLFMQIIIASVMNLRHIWRKNTMLKLLLIPIIFFGLINLTFNNLNEKIYGERSGSGATRFMNTYSSLITIYNNPLLGTGFDFEKYSKELNETYNESREVMREYVSSDKVSTVSSTNSFLRLYVQLGIPIGLFLTISLFYQTIIPRHKFIFGVVVIVSASSAPIMLTPFYFMFVMSGSQNLLGLKKSL